MSDYVYTLKALYEAQEKQEESITYKVLYENQWLEGFVVGVNCRNDTFELEIPGEYESGKLNIWKIQEISEGQYLEIPLTLFGELSFSIPYSYWKFMCRFRFFRINHQQKIGRRSLLPVRRLHLKKENYGPRPDKSS